MPITMSRGWMVSSAEVESVVVLAERWIGTVETSGEVAHTAMHEAFSTYPNNKYNTPLVESQSQHYFSAEHIQCSLMRLYLRKSCTVPPPHRRAIASESFESLPHCSVRVHVIGMVSTLCVCCLMLRAVREVQTRSIQPA